jgi:hypothetical protein
VFNDPINLLQSNNNKNDKTNKKGKKTRENNDKKQYPGQKYKSQLAKTL